MSTSIDVESDERITSDVEGVGDALRRVRKMRGMSQAELAKRVGMRQPAITRLENGHHVPTWRTLSKVADALDAHLVVSVVPSGALTNE